MELTKKKGWGNSRTIKENGEQKKKMQFQNQQRKRVGVIPEPSNKMEKKKKQKMQFQTQQRKGRTNKENGW